MQGDPIVCVQKYSIRTLLIIGAVIVGLAVHDCVAQCEHQGVDSLDDQTVVQSEDGG